MGSALGVGAAEKLRRVGCPLRVARAVGDRERGAVGDRVGLSVGSVVARGLTDTAALALMVVEPPVDSTVRASAGK